jgi:hypothetical protein
MLATLAAIPCDNSSWRSASADFLLQLSHRCGAVALLAMLVATGMIFGRLDYRWPTVAAFAAGDIGFCAAIAARLLVRSERDRRREATGAAIFNFVLLSVSLVLVLLDQIMGIFKAVARFFHHIL